MADRWQRVQELFDAALELPPAARSQYLSDACPDDSALREEVESLLAFEGKEAATMAGAVGKVAAALEHPVPEGSYAGPYRLLREIGIGGMGAVYLAVRADDVYHKEVAVKLVKRGMDSDEIVRRFRNERQILARLEHPRIARLYDGGSTEDGRPYIVMEHVEGVSITRHVRERQLPRRAVLEMFLQVCEAVEHAHRNLVVHRDLKPSNILVTAAGEPKLLDFGIAKVLTGGPDDVGPEQTLVKTGLRLLTPEYASPEQVRGEPVTTATDVYALGAILYELVTGDKAHRFTGISQTELERVICEQDLPRTRLGDDLDTILAMAMRKEPERRYASVAHLAEDIRRYLEHRPVLARPDTFGYRAAKFVRRHRLAVASAALLVMAIAGGVAATVWQARVAAANAARAEQRFAQVRKLANTMLFELDSKISNVAGATEARELLVKTALQYLDSLAVDAGNDVALASELATAYEKVGDIQGSPAQANLGNRTAAQQSYRKAIAIHESILAGQPRRAETLRSLALVLRKYSSALSGTEKSAEAPPVLDRALQTAREFRSLVPGDPRGDSLVMTLLWSVSTSLSSRAQYAASLRYAREAHTLLEAWAPTAAAANADHQRSVVYMQLGEAHRGTGQLEQAAHWLRKTVEVAEKMARDRPGDDAHRTQMLFFYNKLAGILGDPAEGSLGRPQEAIAVFEKAIPVAEEMLTRETKDRRLRAIAAYLFAGFGRTRCLTGPDAALPWLDRSIAIERAPAADTNNMAALIDLSSILRDRAVCLARWRRWAAAEADLQESLKVNDVVAKVRKNALPMRENALPTWIRLAEVRRQAGDPRGAAAALREAASLADILPQDYGNSERILHAAQTYLLQAAAGKPQGCATLAKAGQRLQVLEQRAYNPRLVQEHRARLTRLRAGCSPPASAAQ